MVSNNLVCFISKKSLHTRFVSLIQLLRVTVYEVEALRETVQDIYLPPLSQVSMVYKDALLCTYQRFLSWLVFQHCFRQLV